MKIKLNHQEIDLTPNIKLGFLLEHYPKAQWWKTIIDFLERWANESSTIQVKTSGSTGTPKLLEVAKKSMWISAAKTCQFFELSENSTGLLCLSANYIAGQMMLVRAMVSGMNLICLEPSNNPVKDINSTIDFTALVPMQLQQAFENIEKLNKINNLIIGGGQVSYALCKALESYKGFAYETFGMTETLSHIALKQLTPNLQEEFKLFAGVSINQGFNNQLIINYPELGIYRLKTNDIIELVSGGSFKWIGRSDFVINSGGIKISPEEIETQIAHLIKERFCIIGVSDVKLGEKLILLIEGNSFETSDLTYKIKELLPSYSEPKEIRFIATFPLTESGKIKRRAIVL